MRGELAPAIEQLRVPSPLRSQKYFKDLVSDRKTTTARVSNWTQLSSRETLC